MIKNEAIMNEELDPKLMIQKLKREVQQLKEELALATGEQRTDDLTEEELEKLVGIARKMSLFHRKFVSYFCSNLLTDSFSNLVMYMISGMY